MPVVKVSEAVGQALDYLVAKCEDVEIEHINDGITRCILRVTPFTGMYRPSTDWSQGGPIIEREKIATVYRAGEYWLAYTFDGAEFEGIGPTPLIAAMRCYVASKLGDELEVPEELL